YTGVRRQKIAAGPRRSGLLSTFCLATFCLSWLLLSDPGANGVDARRRLGSRRRVVALGLDHEHHTAVLLSAGFITRRIRNHETGLAVPDRLELRRRHSLGDEIVSHRVRPAL